jgi:hypothetical protein
MRLLLALLVAVLLGLGASACGGAGTRSVSASGSSSGLASVSLASLHSRSGVTPSTGRLRGDEDDDDTSEIDNPSTPFDSDADKDNDARDNAGRGYYDGDDGVVRGYGHAAGGADSRAIAALVERYWAAAAVQDGAAGCALLSSARAGSLPEDYGPSYLPGARTCAAVLTVVFRRLHSPLAGSLGSLEVTEVRVEGGHAEALLGSARMPAGVVEAGREGGAWKLDQVLPTQLP